MKDLAAKTPANVGKFQDPAITAKGETRATVELSHPETLWFNTGTLCNIECVNCYIESSPTNDALVYITADEVQSYLDQLVTREWGVREIAFTGGEPFMNPQMIDILRVSLAAGYEVLILTNAMLPMMRKRVLEGLSALEGEYPGKMTFRVSLDHHSAQEHDQMRGTGAFDKTLVGMDWLRDAGMRMAVAGRTIWGETDAEARAGFAALFEARGYAIDASNPGMTVLFPEMDESVEVPEITTACWDILGKATAQRQRVAMTARHHRQKDQPRIRQARRRGPAHIAAIGHHDSGVPVFLPCAAGVDAFAVGRAHAHAVSEQDFLRGDDARQVRRAKKTLHSPGLAAREGYGHGRDCDPAQQFRGPDRNVSLPRRRDA